MGENKNKETRNCRTADCVTELRRGNTVLTVNGYFKKNTSETAADKMAKVLKAEGELRAIV